MTGRVRAFRAALLEVIARTLAFAAAFGGVGLGINAYAAFGPSEPDPRFGDEIIFESNNAVRLLVVRITVPAFLFGSTIANAVMARQSLLRGCVVAGVLGTACVLVAPFVLAACSAEIVPVALAVLGVASGVVSIRSPELENRWAGESEQRHQP